MQNKRILAILGIIGSMLMISCASTHPGEVGKPLTNQKPLPIIISAKEIDSSKADAFELLEVTIENKSETWFRVKSSKVVIDNPVESGISVVMGSDLKEWGKSMMFRKNQEEHNTKIARGSVAAAGAVAMISGIKDDNSNLYNLGATALLASDVWNSTDVINQSIRHAEGVESAPENHLYHPFSIPGKMFTRKWLLLNKPVNQVITKLVVEIESIDNDKETYEIKL